MCSPVAGPPHDTETLVKQWIATLQSESRVTDEDAEDLMFRIIAYANRGVAPTVDAKPDPYAVLIPREEAAKMAFDAIQSALKDDWSSHYNVLQIAAIVASNIRRISPASPSTSSIRAAAEGISSTFGLKFQEASLAQVTAIIAKHLAGGECRRTDGRSSKVS